MTTRSFLAVLLGIGLAACVADENSDDLGVCPGGKCDGPGDGLLGSYIRDPFVGGEILMLVLKSDMTYYMEDDSLKGSRGSYVLLDASHIRFETAAGPSEYEYQIAEKMLRMRSKGDWFELEVARNAWCESASDCSLQNLRKPSCSGSWSCDSSLCEYACEDASSCVREFGTCEATFDSSRCARTEPRLVSCDPDSGLSCCLPLQENACQPLCDKIGTADEGWYDCTGQYLVCRAQCSGEAAICDHASTFAEGWYTTGAGCGSEVRGEITPDDCAW